MGINVRPRVVQTCKSLRTLKSDGLLCCLLLHFLLLNNRKQTGRFNYFHRNKADRVSVIGSPEFQPGGRSRSRLLSELRVSDERGTGASAHPTDKRTKEENTVSITIPYHGGCCGGVVRRERKTREPCTSRSIPGGRVQLSRRLFLIKLRSDLESSKFGTGPR